MHTSCNICVLFTVNCLFFVHLLFVCFTSCFIQCTHRVISEFCSLLLVYFLYTSIYPTGLPSVCVFYLLFYTMHTSCDIRILFTIACLFFVHVLLVYLLFVFFTSCFLQCTHRVRSEFCSLLLVYFLYMSYWFTSCLYVVYTLVCQIT